MKSIINHSITFNSSFLIVGGLSESYLYGLKMLPNIAAVMLGYMYALLIVYPFMYSLDLKSPYDYLKRRYGGRESVKTACVCLALAYYFSFASLYLWGCAAIVNVLVPESLSLGLANLVLGIYSVTGTLLGGYIQSTKTNAAQFLAVFFGLLTAMYLSLQIQEKGIHANETFTESVNHIFTLATTQNDRTSTFDRHVDLTTRYTILNQLISLPLPWCSKLGIFLPNYVRFKSIGNKSKARLLFISKIPVTILFNAIVVLAGSVFCYAYFYAECDPIQAGRVLNKNQIGVLWLHSVLVDSHVPALSGLVFASIVYFALIQHSICMSTIGRTLYDEIIGPFLLDKRGQRAIRNEFKKKIQKCIPVLIALASIPYATLFQYSKNTMLSLFFIFNNSMNSPILGLFLLSMFNPYANHVGATCAFLLNIAINFWMAIGTLAFSETRNQELNPHTIHCDNRGFPSNITHHHIFHPYGLSSNPHHHNHHHNSISARSTSSSDLYSTATAAAVSNLTNSSTPSIEYMHIHDNEHLFWPNNPLLYFMYSVAPIWYCLFSVLFNLVFGSVFSLVYALAKTGRLDLDASFSEERRKYLFFYRFKHFF